MSPHKSPRTGAPSLPSRLYFGYGANTNRVSMSIRCPAARYVGLASLSGFSLQMRGVADIEPSPADVVQGTVWEVTPACVEALDVFEGYPTLYNRAPLVLDDGREAFAYFMVANRPLSPARGGYFTVLEAGYQDTGLPLAQLYDAERRAEAAWRGYLDRVTSPAA